MLGAAIHPSTLAVAAIGLLLLQVLVKLRQCKPRSGLISKIDAVGVSPRDSIFSWPVAVAKSVVAMQETMREGYEKFSKHGKPFALPTMSTGGAVLVLPPSMLNLLKRPRDEVSGYNALIDNAQFRYLMTDRDVWDNVIHFDIVRKDLTLKNMGPITSVMAEEWDLAFLSSWGRSKNGASVNAWESMVRIVAHAALRVMVGLPGCRNQEYLEQSIKYANAVLTDGCVISCLPPSVRPVLGRIISLRARYHQRKLMKILVPIVEEKMRHCEGREDRDAGSGDVIQWLIRVAKSHGPGQLVAEKIALRILALTPMFIFANGWVFAHAVLDIHSGQGGDNVIETLETECRRVSAEYCGLSSKEAVDALHNVDSAVRESMRLNDVSIYLLPFDLVSGAAIELGQGLRITAGSDVRSVYPAQMVHMDPDLYQNPEHFDPFRFSRGFDPSTSNGIPRGTTRETMTTVSTSFLPFGYGRHACPGRWFTACMMKQAVAYVLLNYDVQILKKPARKASILNFMVPPQDVEMLVTRKSMN
ncbi:cytochrome P450 [Rostrohypoxylon terebratum]|nr:cytochrome P450 [Rostrohypoxylon terebratum]